MPEFLLEILHEDAPHNNQEEIAKNLTELFVKYLNASESIKATDIISMYSTKRISLHAQLQEKKEIAQKKIRGPKNGAPKNAVEGFAKKMNLSFDKLTIESTNSGDFYFATVQNSENAETKILQSLRQAMEKIKFKEQMKMRGSEDIWTRQIINILCMYNDKVINFDFGNIQSSNMTYGVISSNFKSPIQLTRSSKDMYVEELRKNKVIACPQLRFQIVSDSIKKIYPEFDIDSNLQRIIRASNMVDFPKIALCQFEKEFTTYLPEQLIYSAMEYDYLIPIKDKQNYITNKFFLVSNNLTDPTQTSHEQSINRKLRDLTLIFNKDQQSTIEELIQRSKTKIFYNGLGTSYERWLRVEKLSRHIAIFIPYANILLVDKVAPILKIDSVSSTIRYKPELSGILSAYFAKSINHNSEEEEAEKIFNTIIDYNKYLNGSKKCSPESAVFVIAEAIDTMIGICSSTKVNTSHDPMGLRSIADLLIQAIIDHNADSLHIKILLANSIKLYDGSKIKKALKKIHSDNFKFKANIIEEVMKLINSRFKTYILSNKCISIESFESVMTPKHGKCKKISKYYDNLCFCKNLIEVINDFVSSNSGQHFMINYKRALKITYNHSPTKIKKSLFEHNLEEKLFLSIKEANSQINKLLKNGNIEMMIKKIFSLSTLIGGFLDTIKVNDERKDISENRSNLIKKTVELIESLADFEKFIK